MKNRKDKKWYLQEVGTGYEPGMYNEDDYRSPSEDSGVGMGIADRAQRWDLINQTYQKEKSKMKKSAIKFIFINSHSYMLNMKIIIRFTSFFSQPVSNKKLFWNIDQNQCHLYIFCIAATNGWLSAFGTAGQIGINI